MLSIKASSKADIRQLFTEQDILGMTKAFNLANYDDVKTHRGHLRWHSWNRRGGHFAPPKGKCPWPQSRIELFAKWMADGCQH